MAHHVGPPGVSAVAPHKIALTEEEGRFVEELGRSGRCRDAYAVVQEGLRLVVEGGTADLVYSRDELRAAIQVGLDDMAAGRYVEFTDQANLRAHFEALAERALAGPERL